MVQYWQNDLKKSGYENWYSSVRLHPATSQKSGYTLNVLSEQSTKGKKPAGFWVIVDLFHPSHLSGCLDFSVNGAIITTAN